PLSAFDLEPLEGTWTMTVTDLYSGDGGTWNSWCLIPTTMELVGCSAIPEPGATISSTATVCAGSTVALSLENSPIEQGLTYQWYASTDGGATWTPGPTTTAWNAVVNEETIFYCEVTCENP